ncbi:DUF4126 domain-containing protein [Aestuariivirga sp.]|uniref:DUF4126 domain-containing protein n=1 Tax=Aestuariivirga sp. TaxID=2650926 RepID=UPI0039E38ACB
MLDPNLLLPVGLGIGLAAATGFRVFIPLLTLSVAANFGHLPLSDGFAWLGTLPALAMLSVAALAEIAAFYIPAVDNLLDAVATPGAVAAGIAVSAAVMTDMTPMLKWSLAIIAGGGAAAMTQGASAALRAHSTVLTAGLGNMVLATSELGGSLVLSILALAAPMAALALVIAFMWLAFRLLRRLKPRNTQS